MEDATEHEAETPSAAGTAVLLADGCGIVRIAGREVGGEIVADVLLVRERHRAVIRSLLRTLPFRLSTRALYCEWPSFVYMLIWS